MYPEILGDPVRDGDGTTLPRGPGRKFTLFVALDGQQMGATAGRYSGRRSPVIVGQQLWLL